MNEAERYTEVERSQHLTQNDPKVYGASYVANTSSACGKSAFANEEAKHDHVNVFQSFSLLRETGLPDKLPAKMKAEIRQETELIELENQVRQLRLQKALSSEIQAARSKASSRLASLTKKRLEEFQLEWVQQRRDWKVLTGGKERPEDNTKTDLFVILSRIMPELGRLSGPMTSDKDASEEERRQAIQDLYSMASSDCTVSYRPGEKPDNGICPAKSCSVEITR